MMKNNIKIKIILSLCLFFALLLTIMQMNVFAVEADTTGPVITIVSCDRENETLYEGDAINLIFSVEDDAGIGSNGILMTYRDPNGDNYREFLGPVCKYNTNTGLYECTFIVSSTDKIGTYTFAKLHAYDKKGNSSYIRPAISFVVAATENTDSILSGICGESATYTYNELTNTLTISGSGAISDLAFSCYNANDSTRKAISANVKTVIIQEGITEIGSLAFDCCKCTSIKLPNSLEIIRNGAFYCSYITSIEIPDTVTTIEKAAFNMCQSLVDVKLPVNIKIINELTFSGCTKLENINIPLSVEKIVQNAFSNCCSSSLKLNIPCNVELEFSNIGILGDMQCANSFCGIINVVPDSVQEDYFFNNYANEINAGKITLNTTLSHNFSSSVEKEDGTYVEICIICGEEKSVKKHSLEKIEGTEVTCLENGTKEYWYCDICNCYFADEKASVEIVEDIDTWKVIETEGHKCYWYHTDSMGNNAYDLVCSECDENFGRAYLNSDNHYYMYGNVENGEYYHYIYDENAKRLNKEKCKIDRWNSEESYHEGICKCNLILCKEESHYYDKNGDTICNACEYTRSIVESISIDKKLISEGETATITIKVIEGYIAKWMYFYKPITNNFETIYLSASSNNTYVGTFKVDDQTESGVWKLKDLVLKDSDDEWIYIYNSDNYTGTYYDTIDFSSIDFEVVGTDADVTSPVIESYNINKNMVSNGESIIFTAKIIDEHLPSSFYLSYESPSDESKLITMKKIDENGLYKGMLTIDSKTEIGLWRPYRFSVYDTNDNSNILYNSNVVSYMSNKKDLSSLNFEVVEINENNETTEDVESFVVVFKDGYGNTLSTQRITKGEDAVEPDTPLNELYLFNGWDTELTNINSNKVITATWVLKPNITYDREVHVGNTFSIEVYSSARQDYTISCSEDIEFTSTLVGTGMVFSDKLYYSKKYEIEVNEAGSYLFFVKGTYSSNTLSYKVKVTAHNFENKWTIDKEVTCTENGSKSYHCTMCDVKSNVTVIESLGHNYSTEWIIDKAATCTEVGSKSHHCTRCDVKSNITPISILAHNYSKEWIIDKASTCTENGSKSYHCIICGAKSNKTVINALGHEYSKEWTIDKKATCTKNGSKSHHCTRCDAKKNVTVINVLPHEIQNVVKRSATCLEYGEIQKLCKNCNYITTDMVKPLGHIEKGKNKKIEKATMDKYGSIIYRCERCNGVLKTNSIPYISSVKLTTSKYTYNGKKKTPSVIVKDCKGNKLIEGKDYKLTYNSSTRKKIGKYSVKVTFKGNYSGSKTLYFTIGPKNPSSVKAVLYGHDDVKVSWSKVSGATGYKVYYKKSTSGTWSSKTTTGTYVKIANLSDGVKYDIKVVTYKTKDGNKCYNAGKSTSIDTLKKVKGIKVAKSKSKVKISWTNISGETGYQISKSTNKSGTNIVATYKTTSGKSKTISAAKGKKYYYKVRAYKVVNGKKIYGPWSTAVKYVRK